MRVPSSALELRGIIKRFPGVIACDRVDLQVYPGEIHALLGENGAGKTTLMHILYGLHQPDAGEIWIDGKRMVVRSPKDAICASIGMVFQHFTLIPALTVAENIALAATHSHVFMRRKPLTTHVQELAEHYQVPVDPNSPVWQLSVGEQQRVEILKLLHRRARLLILDEPSAVLTPQESEALLQTLRRLANAGHALILITHKLAEALTAAHRITVLRRGQVVANSDPAQVTKSDLARWMLGHDLPTPPTRVSQAATAVELALTEVTTKNDRGLWALRHVSLRPTLLVACNPTRGLDVGAVEVIHRLLLEQRQRGCAILLISEDLDELIALADRITVIYEEEIAGSFRVEETDAATLGLMMAGGLAAGLGGAHLSLAYTQIWADNMTAGRGWIALAMVIFGAWDPVRTALGAYLFGGVQALQLRLQAIGIAVPTYLLLMAPYGFTMLALIIASGTGARRRLGTPTALGTPYIRGA